MRKFLFSLFGLTVLALFTVANVFAQPAAAPLVKPEKTPGAKATEQAEKPKGPKQTAQGTITAVSASALTIELKDGTTQAFVLSAQTQIKFTGATNQADAALAAGMRVSVQAQDTNGTLTALRVMVLPGKPVKVERVGLVTAYTPGSSISIAGKSGQIFTFTLTPATKILPKDRAETLAVGQRVTIISPRSYRDQLIAKGIVIQAEETETEP